VTELTLGWRLATLPTVIVILLVCFGVWMFAQDEPYAPTTRDDSEPTPGLKLVRRFSKQPRVHPAASAQGVKGAQGRGRRHTQMIVPAPIIPGSCPSDEENPPEI